MMVQVLQFNDPSTYHVSWVLSKNTNTVDDGYKKQKFLPQRYDKTKCGSQLSTVCDMLYACITFISLIVSKDN